MNTHPTAPPVLILLAGACALMIAGCGDDAAGKGPAQRAGQATDQAVDSTGDALKRGADKTGEVIKEGAQATGEAVEKAGQKIQDASK